MALANVSRRSFLKLSGATAAVAGLGLAGCAGSGSDSSAAGTVENSLAGVPCTTPLDQLPIPEKGVAYNNPQERDNIQDGGTLTLGAVEIGPDWNYFSINGGTTYMNNFWGLYMPSWLFTTDEVGKEFTPNPDYISDYKEEMVDGKQVVTLTFSDKANFNDGTPIDWRAIESVYKCMSGKDESYTPSSTDGYKQIESVVKGDTDKTAVVTFATPFFPAAALFGVALHPSAADVDVFNNGFVSNPHSEWGAGPFKVDSFDDTQVTFVPNDKWWGDEPKLEKIVYKQMDNQAEFNAFKNGEIDGITGQTGSAEMLSNFSSMSDAVIRRANGLSLANIELNASHGILSDEAVRKAFFQVVDIPTIVNIQFNGVNWQEDVPGSMLIMPWADGYENNLPDDVKDLGSQDDKTAAAKKTLEDAGYSLNDDGFYAKDGTQVDIDFVTIGDANTIKNRAVAIQTMAKSAGINVIIDNHPSSEFSTLLTSGNWGAFLFGWSTTPTGYLNGGQLYGSTSESNFTTLGSKEVDEGFDSATGIEDTAEQKKKVNEVEKEAMKTYAFIPVFVGPDVTVCKAGLANFGPSLFKSVLPQNIGWQKEN